MLVDGKIIQKEGEWWTLWNEKSEE